MSPDSLLKIQSITFSNVCSRRVNNWGHNWTEFTEDARTTYNFKRCF